MTTVVELLVGAGENVIPLTQDDDTHTPAHGIRESQELFVELLLKAGADSAEITITRLLLLTRHGTATLLLIRFQ